MSERRFISDVVLSTPVSRDSYLNTLPVHSTFAEAQIPSGKK